MTERDVVLTSRVRLARNYEDLPFELAQRPESAALCIARTTQALRLEPGAESYDLLRLKDMTQTQQESLAEEHLISRDLLALAPTAAVLLREKDAVSIMMNEEDHLRIQAIEPGLSLPEAAEKCFRVDDALSRHVTFAFDDQLGYLTACPTNTGTGMRASLLCHLPMLTLCKQMGNVGQIVAKVGLTLRGVYGEGSEALGNLYQVSNQVTLGRTEQELISAVTAVGHQLTDMEHALRDKALTTGRLALEDQVFRAKGVLENARVLGRHEFFKEWSALRLGAAAELLRCPVALCDQVLEQCQDAHLCAWEEKALEGTALDEARARRVRELLGNR